MRSAYQLSRVTNSSSSQKGGSIALWVSFMEPHSPFDFPIGWQTWKASDFKAPRIGTGRRVANSAHLPRSQ